LVFKNKKQAIHLDKQRRYGTMRKRFLTFITGVTVSLGMTIATAEVIPGTQREIELESAHLVGSGRMLNLFRVPITDINTGATIYYDMIVQFAVTPTGAFVFNTVSLQEVARPTGLNALIPGKYLDQRGYEYSLEGPSLVLNNRSTFTLRRLNYPFSAQIITGPAAGHPDVGGREIVPFLPNTYIYGKILDGSTSYTPIDRDWNANELIGLRQQGNQLVVSLFSQGPDQEGASTDFAEPLVSVLLSRVVE
jgi:hypothetical protein